MCVDIDERDRFSQFSVTSTWRKLELSAEQGDVQRYIWGPVRDLRADSSSPRAIDHDEKRLEP